MQWISVALYNHYTYVKIWLKFIVIFFYIFSQKSLYGSIKKIKYNYYYIYILLYNRISYGHYFIIKSDLIFN